MKWVFLSNLMVSPFWVSFFLIIFLLVFYDNTKVLLQNKKGTFILELNDSTVNVSKNLNFGTGFIILGLINVVIYYKTHTKFDYVLIFAFFILVH